MGGFVPAVGGFFAEFAGLEPVVDLALDFVGAGSFEDGEGVEVFDFGDGGFVDVAGGVGDVDVDVGLEAHVAHLHLAFGDAEELDELLELLGEGGDFFGGGEVGFGDDFEERGAGAVEVYDGVGDGVAAGGFVEEFSGVFFQMRAADADVFRAVVCGDLKDAVVAEGEVVLGDLVILGEVGVIVGLAVPLGVFGDLAVEGEAYFDGGFNGLFVHDGEGAGEAEDLFVYQGVGGCAEVAGAVGGGGEHLGGGGELDVDFEADEDFV